jgi:hypothetical protein
VRDEALPEAETLRARIEQYFQMKAPLGVGGNGGGVGSFSKSPITQHHPPLLTGDLKWETVNRILGKVEHCVCQGGAAMGTTEFDMCINSAWGLLHPKVCSWFPYWIRQQGVTVIPPAYG